MAWSVDARAPHPVPRRSATAAAVQAGLRRVAQQHRRRGAPGRHGRAQHAQQLVHRERRPAAEDATDQLALRTFLSHGPRHGTGEHHQT